MKGTSVVLLALMVCLFSACREKINPASWLSLETNNPSKLQAVHFVNEQTGFAAGGERFTKDLILRTPDGGQNWVQMDSVFGKIILDLDFLDENRGFASGLDGKIIKTTDGGSSWNIHQMLLWLPMHAVAIVNDSIVVAVGGDGYSEGQIVRSSDFGESWELIDSLEYELREVIFVNELVGYASGYAVIYKTTDGGKSWELTPAEGEFFTGLSFPTPEIGFAVGRSGSILQTTDGGESWTKQRNGNIPLQKRHFYNDVVFLDANTGYIVGDNGLILKTTDGGKKWAKFERNVKVDFFSIHLFEEGRGFIAGGDGEVYEFEE